VAVEETPTPFYVKRFEYPEKRIIIIIIITNRPVNKKQRDVLVLMICSSHCCVLCYYKIKQYIYILSMKMMFRKAPHLTRFSMANLFKSALVCKSHGLGRYADTKRCIIEC